MYAIGDVNVIALAYQEFKVYDENYLVVPYVMEEVSISHVMKAKGSPDKTQFWTFIDSLDNNSPILICMGESDCVKATIKKIDRMRYDKIEDSLVEPIEQMVSLLKLLRASYKGPIFIHPVLILNLRIKQYAPVFNNLLASRIQSEFPPPNDVVFLGFMNALMNDDNESIRSEFIYNENLLRPEYGELIKQIINKLKPPPPKQTKDGQ